MAFLWKTPGEAGPGPMTLEFHFWTTLILIVCAMGAVLGACAYQILLERKISAWAQDRIGPNRVGPLGLLQPIADGLKFLFKEEVIPSHVDKAFYLLAPGIAMTTALLAFAVVPFGQTTPPPQLIDYRRDAEPQQPRPVWPQTNAELEQVLAADEAHAREAGTPSYRQQVEAYNNTVQFVIAPHVDIGIVFVFAVTSLAVYAIVLGGWSSNNKYSLLGSLRSSAQLISYEIPLGLSALGVLLVTGSLNLETVIDYQYRHGWNVLFQPLAALLFATAIFAECNRLPFDLPEAEQELVGGYHTEYSAMKFALFFLGEYTHMITTSFLIVTLFFGGWLLPGVAAPGGEKAIGPALVKLVVFAVKMALFICFFMFVRWTLPRFRFDQLMGLAWKVLMPLALVNALCVLVVKQFGLNPWWLLPLSVLVLVGAGAVTLLMPRAPARAPVLLRGHPVGAPALREDRVSLG
jgi:NADH-quinone oxidoreductase subunit H